MQFNAMAGQKGRVDRNDPRVQKALTARATAAGAFAAGWRCAVLADTGEPIPEMRQKAQTRLWQFAPFRQRMNSEIHGLARAFADGEITKENIPDRYPDCIKRLAIALHLLEIIRQIQTAALEKNNPSSTALFETTAQAVEAILDTAYFSKPINGIVSSYLDAEGVINAACSVFSIPFDTSTSALDSAIQKHRGTVTDLIQAELNAIRGEGKDNPPIAPV
jgi:hypothetical protein